jgi:tellurite resistance protein TerC
MTEKLFPWLIFAILVLICLAIDLGAHRTHKAPSVGNALLWSGFWIALSLLFNLWIYFQQGAVAALNFLTGYLVEKALSVDNLFVFLLIFQAFQIPKDLRFKVLFWGIIGAFVMRILFIVLGVALIKRFHWIFYLFGLFLIYTGIKLGLQKDQEMHPEKNPFVRWVQSWLPMTLSCDSGKFFVKEEQGHVATPLFLCLVAVSVCDFIFAIDSIPAILGITTDPFIVVTSNVFALLGLRSLYFALEGMIGLFHHLHYGLAAVLIFIGIKMVIADFVHIPILFSLGFIAFVLGLAIAASLLDPKPSKHS